MNRTTLATLLLLAISAVGCSSGADGLEASDDALSGTPQAAVDAKRAALRSAIYDGYRAATTRQIRELTIDDYKSECGPSARLPAARTFFWWPATLGPESKRPVELALASELSRSELDRRIVIVQEPTDSTGRSTLKFVVDALHSNGAPSMCGGAPVLVCQGVNETDGPTREQCGL